jgi:hypothetical protein
MTAVLPGTVTRMVCGKAVPGNERGYLKPDGTYVQAEPDPSFMERLRENNRFLIAKK